MQYNIEEICGPLDRAGRSFAPRRPALRVLFASSDPLDDLHTLDSNKIELYELGGPQLPPCGGPLISFARALRKLRPATDTDYCLTM